MAADLQERVERLRTELQALAARREDGPEPLLVAVTKTVGQDAVRAAYAAGLRDFGENRVQDLEVKRLALSDLPGIRWHFIGTLQRNKVRKVVGSVALIHSVDSVPLAEAIQRVAAEEGVARQPVLLEVNAAGEASKAGVALAEAEAAARALAALPRLDVRGLMTMAPFTDDHEVQRRCFQTLAELRGRLVRAVPGFGSELSMGMTNDYRVAVAEGATIVRLGTAIFKEGVC